MSKNLMLLLAILIKISIMVFTPSINSDVWYYFDLAKKMVSGLIPYVDFKFEYPPLAIIPIWIPGLIKTDAAGYIQSFRFFQCALDLGFLFLFTHLFGDHQHYKRFLIIYSLISVFMAIMIYDRLDLIFSFMVFGCLVTTNERSLFWSLLGIPFKLLSAIFVPFQVVSFYQNKNLNLKSFLKWCVLPMALIWGIVLLLFKLKFLMFLSYHHARGIQIESTWATLYFLMQKFQGLGMQIEYAFVSQQLKDVPEWILFLANYSILVFLSLLLLLFYFKKNSLPQYLLTSLLVFMCFAKVLSPQYFIWLMPLMIFFIEEKLQLFLFALITAISGYILIHYGELMAQAPWAWWSLTIRNLALILWVILRFKGHLKKV